MGETQSAKRIEKCGFDIFTGQELEEMQFPELVWLVDGILPLGGAAMLAAPPKRRKSFLAQDLVISVALGRPFLGRLTSEGRTLYLALEDGKRRLQARQRPILGTDLPTNKFQYAVSAPKIDEGLLESIRKWKAAYTDGVLVVIDILQRIRKEEKSNDYALDYAAVAPLNDLGNELGLTILVIHHTRKAESVDDVFSDISGSNGLFGALTTVWMLRAKTDENLDATLHYQGKDLEPGSMKLRFNPSCLRFEPMLNAEAAKEESSNPLVRIVERLLRKTGGRWEGSASEFAEFAVTQPEGRGKTPTAFGKQLNGEKFRFAALERGIDVRAGKGKIALYYRAEGIG